MSEPISSCINSSQKRKRRKSSLPMPNEHPVLVCNSGTDKVDSETITTGNSFMNMDITVEVKCIDESSCDESLALQTSQTNEHHGSDAIQSQILPTANRTASSKSVDENSNKNVSCYTDGNSSASLEPLKNYNHFPNRATETKEQTEIFADKIFEMGSQTKHTSKEILSENGFESNSISVAIEDSNNCYVDYDASSIVTTTGITSIDQSSAINLTKTSMTSSNDLQMVEPQTSTKTSQAPSRPDSVRKRIAALCNDQINFDFKKNRVDIFTNPTGPRWYEAEACTITKTIVPKKLIEAFSFLPTYGKPKNQTELPQFLYKKMKEFVGSGLTNDEFSKLQNLCSEDFLKTGKEPVFNMGLSSINQGFMNEFLPMNTSSSPDRYKLKIIKKHKIRAENDPANTYTKKLKYRGARLTPMAQSGSDEASTSTESDLQPGQDLVFTLRLYRPFSFLHKNSSKTQRINTRHSVFSRNIILLGRQKLTELRDRIVCANDVDMRIDVSEHIDDAAFTCAKELFPSGFIFINNVFYVDTREGCHDTSARIRQWAATRRGLGTFPVRDMAAVTLGDIGVRLGHPEVYMHQGNCEHLFTFSDIRLLNPYDPLASSQYPCHTAMSQYSTVYCTSCAEFPSKWITTNSERVPFDPAFFCDTCLRLYLYKNGKKVGDFKSYSYRGNEINMLKPQG